MALCLKHEFGGLVDRELFGIDWCVEKFTGYQGREEAFVTLSVQIYTTRVTIHQGDGDVTLDEMYAKCDLIRDMIERWMFALDNNIKCSDRIWLDNSHAKGHMHGNCTFEVCTDGDSGDDTFTLADCQKRLYFSPYQLNQIKLLHKELCNLLKAIEYCKTHNVTGGAL